MYLSRLCPYVITYGSFHVRGHVTDHVFYMRPPVMEDIHISQTSKQVHGDVEKSLTDPPKKKPTLNQAYNYLSLQTVSSGAELSVKLYLSTQLHLEALELHFGRLPTAHRHTHFLASTLLPKVPVTAASQLVTRRSSLALACNRRSVSWRRTSVPMYAYNLCFWLPSHMKSGDCHGLFLRMHRSTPGTA